MNDFPLVPLSSYREYPEDEMAKRARDFQRVRPRAAPAVARQNPALDRNTFGLR